MSAAIFIFVRAYLERYSNIFIPIQVLFFYYNVLCVLEVQTGGMQKLYSSDASFYRTFRYLKALAFVPPVDVFAAFEWVKTEAPESFTPMIEYFETFYIGKINPRNENQRVVPMFPIKLWSVYDRVINGMPRTNNSLEAWHKVFAVILNLIT